MNKTNTISMIKKSSVILMIAIISVFASGCSLFGGDDTEPIEPAVQEKHIGVLRSLGGMSVGDSTHLLEENDGTTIRLRSDNVDLNSEKYLTKKVEVRGSVTKTDDGKSLMEVKSIDLSEDEKDDSNINKEAEIEYINAELGFKLKYSDNWKAEDNGGKIVFTSPAVKAEVEIEDTDEIEEEEEISNEILDTKDVVTIQRLQNPDKQPLDQFLELPADPNELITLGYTETLVGVDHLEGYKKQSSDFQSIDLYVVRDKYVYYMKFEGADTERTMDNRNIFFSMTSSFQTIGFSSTEGGEEISDEILEEGLEGASDAEVSEHEEIPAEFTDTTPEETGSASDAEISEHEEIPTEFTPPTTTEPEIDIPQTASASDYADVSDYISTNIDSIAPESSEDGSWAAYSFEYVDPNYVYVEYSDGTDKKRVLLTYDENGSIVDTDVVGYFEPGAVASWERVSGENPVATSEKTIVSYDVDEGATTETVIKEGYRYFESLPYDFLAQYPSNWYYSGNSGGDDVMHHYGFSSDPVENGNEMVSIDIVSGSLPAGSPISIGSYSGVKVTENGQTSIYIEREDGKIYKVYGESGNEAYIVDIAASITAN